MHIQGVSNHNQNTISLPIVMSNYFIHFFRNTRVGHTKSPKLISCHNIQGVIFCNCFLICNSQEFQAIIKKLCVFFQLVPDFFKVFICSICIASNHIWSWSLDQNGPVFLYDGVVFHLIWYKVVFSSVVSSECSTSCVQQTWWSVRWKPVYGYP
jgi:hypothetical protein